MATINDLNTSITQMLPDEAQTLVKSLREARRINKGKFAVRKKAGPKTPKKPEDIIPLLTDEQKQQLLALLEGE